MSAAANAAGWMKRTRDMQNPKPSKQHNELNSMVISILRMIEAHCVERGVEMTQLAKIAWAWDCWLSCGDNRVAIRARIERAVHAATTDGV